MNALSIEHTTVWRALAQKHGPALAESDITPLDFMQEVELAPTYVLVKGGIEPTPKLGAIVRRDGQVVGEGLGRGTYGVVQPSEVYQFGREVEALSDWPLVACGEIRDGSQFFFTYRGEPVRAGQVNLDPYCTVMSSHDGTLPFMALHSVFFGPTPLVFGLPEDRTQLKHTSQKEDRSLAALQAVQGNMKHLTHCSELVKTLRSTQLAGWQDALDVVLPAIKGTSRAATLRFNARHELGELLRDGWHDGTAWGFVGAVAFYEAWAAPVRRSASDDETTEHETRAVRQFDALVRTNRQQLTRQALSLFT